MEPLIDHIAIELGLSGIEDEINKFLDKKQEKRQYKDAGERTGWSRKERAAYKTLINSSDIDNLEKNEAVAVELVQKKRVWPKLDIAAQQDAGVSAGTAYLKNVLQQKYMAKPLKNTAKHREVYIKTAETIMDNTLDAVSVNELRKTMPVLLDIYNDFIMEGDDRKKYIALYELKPYFSVTFLNAYEAIKDRSFYKNNAGRKIMENAVRYDGITKEVAAKNLGFLKERLAKAIERYKQPLAELKNIYEWKDVVYYNREILTFSGGMLKHYLKSKDTKGYLQYVRNVYERWIKEAEEEMNNPEKWPWNCIPHQPDWSWQEVKRTKKQATKTDSEDKPVLNSGKPLEYIKRTGGLRIDNVSEKFIIDKLGFKGITLGNYVKDEESREHIRHFIGAITDLCEILDFDTKTINKPLSMGFGAYGRGGRAMATYYPAIQTINLTKRRGDGCVAHEWGHYFDNFLTDFDTSVFYISVLALDAIIREAGYFSKYINNRKNGSLNPKTMAEFIVKAVASQKTETAKAFIWLMGYIRLGVTVLDWEQYEDRGVFINHAPEYTNYSEFYHASAKNGQYWKKPQELFARAWETYIFTKLEKAGRMNNYLVSGDWFSDPVYPQDKERETIYRLFDNLIAAVKKDKNIPGFKPWTTKRDDEYIVLDTKKKEETVKSGIIVADKKENTTTLALAEAEAEAEMEMLELMEMNYKNDIKNNLIKWKTRQKLSTERQKTG